MDRKNIVVGDDLRGAWPGFVGGAVMARVVNTPFSEGLWQEIEERKRKAVSREEWLAMKKS